MSSSRRSSWPGPEYHVTTTFRAPVGFSFAWCTDFSPQDSKLEGEEYTRRIIERSPRRVVYEDLEDADGGWAWARYVVTLRPPSQWHMESVGTRRQVVADYWLRPLPNGGTHFELRFRRRPGILPFRRRGKREFDAELTRIWRRFARALERDFRRQLAGR